MVNVTCKNNTITSTVADFYAGKSIVVTGGTGFIGKVLVEKLLYSCTDIDKIYLLVRGKENCSSSQRVQELIEKPIFDRIKKISPASLNKLVPVSGDITENNLGINTEDEQSLLDKVSVVFHSAATVRFDERLDIAVSHNLEATKRLLNLSHRMKNLESLVFVSTAFISPQNQNLDEVVYLTPVGPKELQAFIHQGGMDNEEELMKFLHPINTFTKALAESYVATNHGSIPTAIIRPCIVGSAVSEPMPGWIDSWSVASAIVATTCLGYNRVIVGESGNHIDLIPVDYVTNLAIVAAVASARKNKYLWCSKLLATFESGVKTDLIENLFKVLPILSVTPFNTALLQYSRNVGKIIIKKGKETAEITGTEVMPRALQMSIGDDLSVHSAIITKDGMRKEMASFILEKLPAMIADTWLSFKGNKPRYVKLQSRISSNRELIKFFCSRSYNMSADKTIALSRSLSKRDAD